MKQDEAGVLEDLSALEGASCAGCSRILCGHHALLALVMGFKSAPRCAECLAVALEMPYGKFLDQVVDLVHHRDCYRSGWTWAGGRENLADSRRPPCLAAGDGPRNLRRPVLTAPAGGSAPSVEDAWDAGSMGCGDLVLELRIRIGRLAPGGVLRLTARDPGAPEDIPAWCRLTGHALLEMNSPFYMIRRKES